MGYLQLKPFNRVTYTTYPKYPINTHTIYAVGDMATAGRYYSLDDFHSTYLITDCSCSWLYLIICSGECCSCTTTNFGIDWIDGLAVSAFNSFHHAVNKNKMRIFFLCSLLGFVPCSKVLLVDVNWCQCHWCWFSRVFSGASAVCFCCC